jgi:hypothetical protein
MMNKIMSLVPNSTNIYQYGSRVYGCNTDASDYDFIAIQDGLETKSEIIIDNINITVYNNTEFEKEIEQHEISIFECLFLPADKIVKEERKFEFNLSLPQLRKSISEKASNSFVKAKKKLIVAEDFAPYIGKKSLFHSFRIILFGIQIAKYGKIVDYSAANHLYNEIVLNESNDWNYYFNKYKQSHNELMTEFRKLAPKDAKLV